MSALTLSSTHVKKLRLGFLGVGWIGKHRMEALIQSGLAEAAVIGDILCNSNQLSGLPAAAFCSTLEEMLYYRDLDGIVIATPSALHAEQAIGALESGFPVFCQKPLGRTAQEVAAVISTAQSRNKLLGLDLSYRFLEGSPIVQQMVQSGEIGEIYAIEAVFHNAYGPDKAWFYDAQLSGGGCVIDLGIHLVDLALWILGFPSVRRVSSKLFAGGKRICGRQFPVEDFAAITIDLQSGCTMNISCSWNLPAGCDAIIGLTMYGTGGGVSIHNVNGSFYDFIVEHFSGTSTRVLCNPPDTWGGRAIVNWAERLVQSDTFDREINHALEVAGILDTIYQLSD